MGSPALISFMSMLWDFDRRPNEPIWIIPKLPISLSGKTVLVDVFVVTAPLYFHMLLGSYYVYAMNDVVSSLFHVVNFLMKEALSQLTIDHLS